MCSNLRKKLLVGGFLVLFGFSVETLAFCRGDDGTLLNLHLSRAVSDTARADTRWPVPFDEHTSLFVMIPFFDENDEPMWVGHPYQPFDFVIFTQGSYYEWGNGDFTVRATHPERGYQIRFTWDHETSYSMGLWNALLQTPDRDIDLGHIKCGFTEVVNFQDLYD